LRRAAGRSPRTRRRDGSHGVRVEALADRRGGVLVIEGPGGIGKSRLLAHLREEGSARGFRVTGARGAELEQDFAFGLVRQLLDPVLVEAGPDGRRELLGGAAALAAPLFAIAAEGQEVPVPTASTAGFRACTG
jgi:hypothetical protein